MSGAEVIKLMRAEIARAGSVKVLAHEWKVAPAYLADLSRGRRVPGPKILRALGLERVKTVTYQPRKKPWHGRPATELPPESDAPPPPRRGRPRGPVISTAAGVLGAARLAIGLTLTEMAARCDLSAPYLSRLEAGHAGQPDRETSRRLAAGYGFSPARIRAPDRRRPADPLRAAEWLRGRATWHRERAEEMERIARELEAERDPDPT